MTWPIDYALCWNPGLVPVPALRPYIAPSRPRPEPEAVRRHRLLLDVERDFGGGYRNLDGRAALSVVELAESPVALDRLLALLKKHGFLGPSAE